jgi:hypothetical protein
MAELERSGAHLCPGVAPPMTPDYPITASPRQPRAAQLRRESADAVQPAEKRLLESGIGHGFVEKAEGKRLRERE